jgi:predicted transposase/invertase (TIGR01784 family)
MESYVEPERNYKNNVFVDFIGTKDRLIEVYNAVKGTDYPRDTAVELNTLKNVLYRFIQNDISFVLDGRLVVLIEHQATINSNMCLRMLEYISKIYDKMVDNDAYYRKNRILLPRPEFIVLYNGKEKYDEKKVMRLSDSFLGGGDGDSLELIVNVYNINPGMNEDLVKRSRSLHDYATLTSKVREYEEMYGSLEIAVGDAIKYCVENNIMVDYLREHGSDIMSILVHEYSYEDEVRVAKQEGRVEGRAEGHAEGRAEGHAEGRVEERIKNARRMKTDGIEPALISKYTGLSEEEIAAL